MSALLHKLLSPAECYEVSALLETKYLALRALPATESSNARVAREAAEAYERDVLGPHLVEQGYGEELLRRPSEAAAPPLIAPLSGQGMGPVGRRVQDGAAASGEPDPWDLPPEELNHTAALPREVPAYWGRDRGDFDELDNRSDIQPFTREGKP